VRDTWLQLRALAWKNNETPPITMKTLAELTGKSERTLYGHMRVLKSLGALRWRKVVDAVSSQIIVSIPEDEALCEILSCPDNVKPVEEEDSNPLTTTPARILQPVVYAIAAVTDTDASLMYSRLAKEAKSLVKAGYNSEDIMNVFGEDGTWYKDDWRGKKGQKPTMYQIRESIKRLKNSSAKKAADRDPHRYIKGELADWIEHERVQPRPKPQTPGRNLRKPYAKGQRDGIPGHARTAETI
jgi:hypothetical protein